MLRINALLESCVFHLRREGGLMSQDHKLTSYPLTQNRALLTLSFSSYTSIQVSTKYSLPQFHR